MEGTHANTPLRSTVDPEPRFSQPYLVRTAPTPGGTLVQETEPNVVISSTASMETPSRLNAQQVLPSLLLPTDANGPMSLLTVILLLSLDSLAQKRQIPLKCCCMATLVSGHPEIVVSSSSVLEVLQE